MTKFISRAGVLAMVTALAWAGTFPGTTALGQDARPASQRFAEPRYSELPNFHQVNEHLYRGAQPGKGGMKKLAELGMRTVVNLRGEADLSRKEQTDAAAQGLRYFSIPMPGLSRPTDQQVTQVMKIIDAPENWPVFIHCQHGSDRTGTIVACYHISHDGWTVDRSITEARGYGMSWVEFGMRNYIGDYYRISQAAKKEVKSAEDPVVAASQKATAGKP